MEFKNFISLGYYCNVAASMSRLGIRSQSGPFDWYISDFQGVLDCLENNFGDFLYKENLQECMNGFAIKDVKHNFYLRHEISISFAHDYADIYDKYIRRINFFREQIKQPTCFIRAVRDDNELDFIKSNMEYINSIIKKSNDNNEIIYIASSILSAGQEISYPFFVVESMNEGGNEGEIRKLFDSNTQLKDFIVNHFNETVRYKNMVFDLQKENSILQYRYGLMKKISQMNMKKTEIPREIIIYGAGNVGKSFYQKINSRCRVLFFLDRKPKEDYYEGVPVIQDRKILKAYTKTPIIVTACYEYEKIKESLLLEADMIDIYSLEDFLI